MGHIRVWSVMMVLYSGWRHKYLKEKHRISVRGKKGGCSRRKHRKEIAGGWKRLHNEELHNFYASQNTIRVNSSRTVRWADHVARMGEMRKAYKTLTGKPERKRPLGRLRVDGRIILEWILGKQSGKLRSGCIWPRVGTTGAILWIL